MGRNSRRDVTVRCKSGQNVWSPICGLQVVNHMPTVQINRIGSICRTEGQNPRRSLNKEDFVKFKPDSTYLNFNPWIRKRQYVSDLIKMQYYITDSYQCVSSRRSWYTFFFWYASFSITSWCMIDQFVLFTFFLRYYHKNVSAFFLFRSVILLQYPIRNVFSIHIMSVHESKLFCNFLERSFFCWYCWEKTFTRIVSLLRKAFSIQFIWKVGCDSSWRTRPSLSMLSFMMWTICLAPLTLLARLPSVSEDSRPS